MLDRLRSWQQQVRKTLLIIGITSLLVVVVVLIWAGYSYNWAWTGFSNKTLWDWLNLLGVLAIPVVVGLGAAWYTAQQGKVSDRENTDNQREIALQAYIDKMSELLLKEHLDELTPEGKLKPEYEEVRKIARVRTLTVLPRLDSKRKRSILQFLYESGLINKDKRIIDLSEADLSGADLSKINLSQADLRKADLSGADLSGVLLVEADLSIAILWRANLWNANLRRANLVGAEMSEANLIGANIAQSNLREAKSLKGTIMPDGTKYA